MYWPDFLTDDVSGCRVVLYWEGSYSADVTNLQLTPTGGEVEIRECNDVTANVANRAYTDVEIASAASSLEWIVISNTLELIHSDGLERIYERQ